MLSYLSYVLVDNAAGNGFQALPEIMMASVAKVLNISFKAISLNIKIPFAEIHFKITPNN